MIDVDGCHIKGIYTGHILSAVVAKPNNSWWHIVYVVAENEPREQWQ